MPRRKKQEPADEPHIYSVWVNDARGESRRVYIGSSEYSARDHLSKAILGNEHAHSVEIRRDLRPWIRVLIERLPDGL